jgi:hypothetical protein
MIVLPRRYRADRPSGTLMHLRQFRRKVLAVIALHLYSSTLSNGLAEHRRKIGGV